MSQSEQRQARHRLHICCSPDEKADMQQRAERQGISLSAHIKQSVARRKMLAQVSAFSDDSDMQLVAMTAELKRTFDQQRMSASYVSQVQLLMSFIQKHT